MLIVLIWNGKICIFMKKLAKYIHLGLRHKDLCKLKPYIYREEHLEITRRFFFYQNLLISLSKNVFKKIYFFMCLQKNQTLQTNSFFYAFPLMFLEITLPVILFFFFEPFCLLIPVLHLYNFFSPFLF